MRRRSVLRLAGLLGAVLATGGHTPYRQWQVYRRRHLLIGTSRSDPLSYALGKRIVEVLLEHLPESSARVTRGPDPWRLASLLTTAQLDVVLLSEDDASALRDGHPPFEAFGPTELRALFRAGDHLLISRPDFPDRHAWRVAGTLTAKASLLPAAAPAGPEEPVPVHPGALAFAAGDPLPAGTEIASEDEGEPDHVH